MKSCLYPNSDGLFIPLAFPYSVSISLAESNIFFVLIPASVEYLYSLLFLVEQAGKIQNDFDKKLRAELQHSIFLIDVAPFLFCSESQS